MNKTKATYVSVWDGDVEIRTDCMYDIDTGTVSDVNGIDNLNDEYIELPDGTQIRSFYNKDNDEFVGDVVCPDCGSDNIIIDTNGDPDSWGWCCNENKPIYDFPKIK